MRTFGSFTTARLGIYASQASLNVTGNNIANINTTGYTRQRMDLVSLYSTGQGKYANIFNTNVGYGVLTRGATQLRDPYLDIRYRNENSKLGANDEKYNGLSQISSILDEVGKGDGEFGEENKVELSNGSYTITASENGVYKVKVVTNTGTEKIYTYEVNNIVKADEEVTLSLSVNYGTSGGVQFKYKGTGTNGALYVKKDGGEAVKVASLDTFTATQAGKYEFYYENAVGKTSETHTYYVTDEKTEANFGTVSVGEDGTVTVTGKDDSAVTAKLYRAEIIRRFPISTLQKTGNITLKLPTRKG